jgi:hypothetical protein
MILRFLQAALLPAVLTAGFVCSSCSSVSCGPGTVEKGDKCVAADGSDTLPDFEFAGAQAAAPVSSTSILVAWLPVEEEGVTYNVYLSTSENDFNYAEPQFAAPAGASTAVLTGLEADTTYYAVVRAVSGEVEVPNEVVVSTTTADDTESPRFAGAVSAEAAPGAAVTLTWEAATDDLTPAGALLYFVFAGPTAEDIDRNNPVGVSAPGATSVTVRLPQPETEYHFWVQARDAAGNFDGNEVIVSAESGEDVEAPVFAGCKAAIGRSASSILVIWEPARDDIFQPEAITYNLYASETPDGFNLLAPDARITGPATSGTIPGLKRDTQYYVLCRAEDGSGNEDQNLRIQSARTKDDDVPPDFGGIIALSNLSSTTLDLSWVAATDNKTATKDIVYDVFVSKTSGDFDFEEGEPWVTSPAGATGITVEALDPNTTYYFVVVARDEGGNRSVPQPEVVATTFVSFQVNVLGIFASKGCAVSGCHTGATPIAGLSLTGASAYDDLVDVDAVTLPAYKRVVPGNPEDSHLVHRITGVFPPPNDPPQARMPADGNFLSDAQVAIIEAWITQGAENN